MSLQTDLKEKQGELGQATQTARKLGLELNNLQNDDKAYGEKQTAFFKARDDAKNLAGTVQELQARLELDTFDVLAQGDIEPTVEHSIGAAAGSEGQASNRDNGALAIARATAAGFQARHDSAPVRSDDEMLHRFGVTHEAHRAAFGAYLRGRESDGREAWMRAAHEAAAKVMERAGVGPQEVNLHSLIDDQLGGFTVSDDFRAEVIRALPGFTVIRASGARTITTGKPIVSFPVVNRAATFIDQYTSDMNQGDTNWRAEGATQGGTARTPQDKPTFGMENIAVHIWQPDPIELTQELLDDSDVNLEGLLAELIAETMGMDQDVAFLRGDGVDKPEGILNGGSIEVTIANAGEYAVPIAGDDGFSYPRIVDMYTNLAAQYRQNARWYMNSDTFGRLLRIEDANKQPLFPINAIPGTMLNRPMWFTEFLDDGSTASNKPIIFGDPRFYVIAERRQLGIVRLVERYAPNIALQPTARVGGQVVLPEAFRIGNTIA